MPLREENGFYPDLDGIPADVKEKAKLAVRQARLVGHNTDVPGFLAALDELAQLSGGQRSRHVGTEHLTTQGHVHLDQAGAQGCRRQPGEEHHTVQEVLTRFPGAKVVEVRHLAAEPPESDIIADDNETPDGDDD